MSWSVLKDSDTALEKSEWSDKEQPNMFTDDINAEQNNETELAINFIVNQMLSSNGSSESDDVNWLEFLKTPLSNWQKSQLKGLGNDESGMRCLLNSWLVTQQDLMEGTYCNATWDNVYCWPPTPLGTTINRTCLDAFTETEPLYASHLKGHGYRVCQANGSWLWGNWTNYTECADSYDAFVDSTEKRIAEKELVSIVQHILFVGPILSLFCVLSALTIFYYFRVLRCDRITLHIHLMAALMLRYIMLFIITEPLVLQRSNSYRNVEWICKAVLIIYLYATMSSINWMFIQGIYINGKLTTNVFHGKTPFKVYYIIGWLLPLVLIVGWSAIMHANHTTHCWSGYAEMNEIWLIMCPIIFVLIVTFLFLINIVRIIKAHTNLPNSDISQFRRAAKATIFLFPLLGINNLLFLYNPGGVLHKYFVILNTLFGSTQGIFVAIVYCYMSKDVRAAFCHVYRRFMVRRSASRIQRRTNTRNGENTGDRIVRKCESSHRNGHRAKLVMRNSQLSLKKCCGSLNDISNQSINSGPSHTVLNLSQQNLPHEIRLNHNNSNTLTSNSEDSAESHSFSPICVNTSKKRSEYHQVHRNYMRNETGSVLVPAGHSWSSYENAIEAVELLGSSQQRQREFACGSIALKDLN